MENPEEYTQAGSGAQDRPRECPLQRPVNMPLPWSFSALLLGSVLGILRPNNDTENFTSGASAPYCSLPTCHAHALDNTFQKGDEEAGQKTHDPFGPGKK
ncbi:hypothetical protein QTP86_022053 [Hemibagrus guttatus]|nr:hypothetical protein QTP86_022053 [Hemibagrus guttatus]